MNWSASAAVGVSSSDSVVPHLTGELAGRQIRVTKEAPKAPEKIKWVKKDLSERTNIIHYAKGPDGTRGFAIGRGKARAEPSGQSSS